MSVFQQRLLELYRCSIARYGWIWIISLTLASLSIATELRKLEYSSDYRAYFGENNPELNAFDSLEETYTKTDSILFVFRPDDSSIFTKKTLGAISDFTTAAWKIPYAIRVDSITNFQHTKATRDDLIVANLVDDATLLSGPELKEVKRIALHEPALVKRLISTDASTTGIAVTLQFPDGDHTQHLPLSMNSAERLRAQFKMNNPEIRIAITGLTAMGMAELRLTEDDMITLVPVMYGVIIVLMILLLRSAWGTFATLLVVSLSAAVAMGLMAALGIKITASSAAAPIIILTIAIADCVHLLLSTFDSMENGLSKREAVFESVRINAHPVFLTSLTTAIGFLSLNFSDSPPFHDLGNVAAIGVIAAWVLSITFFPALLLRLPLTRLPQAAEKKSLMMRFGDIVVSYRIPLLWGTLSVLVTVIAFIPSINIDDRFVKWFGKSTEFRQDSDFATTHLTGPYTLEFSIGSGTESGIFDPDYLEKLDSFAIWLRSQPSVVHVSSFSDVLKRLNRSLHDDDQDWYKLPDSRNLAAQYFLLFEMSLPYGLDLNSQVSTDKSASRLTVTLDTVPTNEMRSIARQAEVWLVHNAPKTMWAKATGTSIMFAYLTERNIRGMLTGTAIAFLLIAGILILALRSIRLGLLSLVSNFFPVLFTFGLWAIVVGEMGIIASVITATSLGLIVDDTVHILSKYNRAKRELRLSTHDAVRFTFSHVGNALWITTLVLVAGFVMLTFSDFRLTERLGSLTAITLAAAVAVDFLILPPLLMLIDREPDCKCATCTCAPTLTPGE